LASEVTNLSGYQTKVLNQFAHRNLVINGDMQIAQRGTSTASITSDTYGAADRWRFLPSSQGTWTMSQENDAPTGSGFAKSTKVLCTTADASPAAADFVRLDQRIEGQNLQHIKKGTSAAEQVTLSFWVKSNVTGTYAIRLYDNDNTRQTAKTYTINASATWEYKTITFSADTTGAFDNDNAASLILMFMLGAGTDYTSGTLQTTWSSYTAANSAVGQVNLASAISNYWQVTGIQLEVGDTATPFEFKSIEDDLLECQRYYEKTYNQGVNPGTSTSLGIVGAANGTNTTGYCIQTASFKVTKRGTPTVTVYDTAGNSGKITTYVTDGTPTTNKTATVDEASQSGFRIYETGTNKNGFFWHYVSDSEL
jgi:hypothetical protein